MQNSQGSHQPDFEFNQSPPVRNYQGYLQVQQSFEMPIYRNGKRIFKTVKRWQFFVTGFIEERDTCHVLMFDRTETEVSIDKKNRITINGKKFSPLYWNH